jgi:hypothetical protein
VQSIDRDSRQYVQALVDVTVAGQPYNPTADQVDFAFTPVGARPATWYPGGWDGTASIPGSNAYRAQVLVGPGSNGPTLAAGRYAVWLRITDDPEQPVLNVGQLSVT